LIKDIDPKNISFALSRGCRSMMAASIWASGFRNFTEVEGGFNAITNTTKTDFVCQSKVLSSI
jgi:hypothetical protein